MPEPSTSFATPRSALFVPGDRPDRHDRALASGADVVLVDLEDAVAPDRKDEARAAVAATLPGRDGAARALVRINPPRTEAGQADLEAAPRFGAAGLVVPKADPESVALAAAAGLPLVALVETAAGVLRAPETASQPGVAVLMLGPVDLGVELGLRESHDGDELLVGRGQLVLAAAAAGLSGPLDGPCLAVRDEAALALELDRAKRLGFAGKSCIHPDQVAAVNAAFSPDPEEVEWANRVIDAFADAAGGAVVLDGQMVDLPVVLRARQIIANDERGNPK